MGRKGKIIIAGAVLTVCCLVGQAHSEESSNEAIDAAGYAEHCLPGGRFTMGSNVHYPEEKVERTVVVEAFCIDTHEVTNGDFAEFVRATGYKTVAEAGPSKVDYPNAPSEFYQPGSAVFVLPDSTAMVDSMSWWQFKPDANWRYPTGGESSIANAQNHPVVHVAYADALAYARWHGRDLPSEAEWEFAARGGIENAAYAWGDVRAPNGEERANTWQGHFPMINEKRDGHTGAAPVGSFAPNQFGLFDMIGNVWEWTKEDYRIGRAPDESERRVIKGGSFLCAPNYCARYRPAARQPQDTGLGTNHIGFRTVRRQ